MTATNAPTAKMIKVIGPPRKLIAIPTPFTAKVATDKILLNPPIAFPKIVIIGTTAKPTPISVPKIPTIVPIHGCAFIKLDTKPAIAVVTLNTTAPTGAIPFNNPHIAVDTFLINCHAIGPLVCK